MKSKQAGLIIAVVIALLSFSSGSQAQSIVLRGKAIATNGRSVQLELNDTLRKIWRSVPDQPLLSAQQQNLARQVSSQAVKVMESGRYIFFTDSAGQFNITAQLRDSVQFSAYRHFPQKFAVRDLQRQPQIHIQLVPQPCQEYTPCEEKAPTTFVFIGRKIRVNRAEQPYYCNRISMDSKFRGRYQLVSNVSGVLPDSVLEFTAYDHYGWPGFSRYETVLLFVSRYCGEYVQQKYMYYPLYKTLDGRWASPVMANDLEHPMAKAAPKPHTIRFAAPVEIDIANFDAERVKELYPAPYYRVANGKAIAEYGNYVDELVEIQRQTVLKARDVKLK
jgi:hypothetical protein